MVTHGRQTANTQALAPGDTFFYVSYSSVVVSPFTHPHLSSTMGRPPWATAEQLVFLHSYIPELAPAKTTTGLTVLYQSISVDFLVRWQPEPYSPHKAPDATPEKLQELTMTQHYNVRTNFHLHYALPLMVSTSVSKTGTRRTSRRAPRPRSHIQNNVLST